MGGDVVNYAHFNCLVYLPLSDEWRPLKNPPHVRFLGGCFLMEENLFFIGGRDEKGYYLSAIDSYSLTSHSWSTLDIVLPAVPSLSPEEQCPWSPAPVYANQNVYQLLSDRVEGFSTRNPNRYSCFSYPIFTPNPKWVLECVIENPLGTPVFCTY